MLFKSKEGSLLWEDRELKRRRATAIDAMLDECEPLPAHEKLMRIMKWMGVQGLILNAIPRRDLRDLHEDPRGLRAQGGGGLHLRTLCSRS